MRKLRHVEVRAPRDGWDNGTPPCRFPQKLDDRKRKQETFFRKNRFGLHDNGEGTRPERV